MSAEKRQSDPKEIDVNVIVVSMTVTSVTLQLTSTIV